DALDTIRALLHHAAAAHTDLRVAQQLQRRRLEIAVLEEIEVADFVWAVVGAIARPDAAVVDHIVQSLGAVGSRSNWTHQFARRDLTLHAWHQLLLDARTLEVRVDPQPEHLAAAPYFFLANDGNVVLRLAGDDACIAAHARIESDHHAPGIAWIRIGWIDRLCPLLL